VDTVWHILRFILGLVIVAPIWYFTIRWMRRDWISTPPGRRDEIKGRIALGATIILASAIALLRIVVGAIDALVNH
jgi:hypothetical protein